MATNPETLYVGKIKPASADYPYGEAQDITLPSDGTGTPWKASFVNDLFGFQQSLLSEAGIVPSGSPDKVGASQYLSALKKISGSVFKTKALAINNVEVIAFTSDDVGRNIIISTGVDKGVFVVEYNAAPGTYSDDGAAYTGRVFIPLGGDGTIGIVRVYDSTPNVKWYGATGDGATDDTTTIQTAIDSGLRSLFFPEGDYYLATPLQVSGGIKLMGNSGFYDFLGNTTSFSPATVAIRSVNPDAQTDQGLYIDGIAFVGGSNPIDLGKFHIVQIENCTFSAWSGHAICLYQGEKHSFRNLFFYPTVGVAESCFSFCTKADSTLVLTGTDSLVFIDRLLLENIFLSPVPGEPANGVNYLLKCGGQFAHATLINVVAHATQKESFLLNDVEWCNFANVTIDGGGLVGTPQTATINILGEITDSVFHALSLAGGVYYRTNGFKVDGAIHRTTFESCDFGTGDNAATFGFNYTPLSDSTSIFIRCKGSFYSAIANSSALRGSLSHISLGCNFTPTNMPPVSNANVQDEDMVGAALAADSTGAGASTAQFSPAKFANGAGAERIPFYLKLNEVWVSGAAKVYFANAFGESFPQVITVSGNGVSPEGNITAVSGSLCMYYSGSAAGKLYVKETGSGNTGWVLK